MSGGFAGGISEVLSGKKEPSKKELRLTLEKRKPK